MTFWNASDYRHHQQDWPHRFSRQRLQRCHKRGSTPPPAWWPSGSQVAVYIGSLHTAWRRSGRRIRDKVLVSRSLRVGTFCRPRCSPHLSLHLWLKHVTGVGDMSVLPWQPDQDFHLLSWELTAMVTEFNLWSIEMQTSSHLFPTLKSSMFFQCSPPPKKKIRKKKKKRK